MSAEHSRQRKLSAQVRQADTPPPVSVVAYTISEFCAAHRVSRPWLYQQWKLGRGPKFMRAGTKRIITGEEAAAWRESEVASSRRAGNERRRA